VKYVFAALRLGARYVPGVLKVMMRSAFLREVLLAVPFSLGSARMPACDAQRSVADLSASTAFDETFAATQAPLPRMQFAAPVTVVFGTRDWILPKASQHRDTLPAHTRWIRKPGWGHVPMWADPVGVSRLILEGTTARGVTREHADLLTVVA
jgi:pimeloyl-ACP methyl ester carboxylesterase